MGKHKPHSYLQPKRKDPPATNTLDLAFSNQLYLANYDLRVQKEARRLLAVDKVAKNATEEISNSYTDWDLGCAVIVAHRMFGIEGEKAVEFLDAIQNLTREFVEEGINYLEVWEKVEEECGVEIDRQY